MIKEFDGSITEFTDDMNEVKKCYDLLKGICDEEAKKWSVGNELMDETLREAIAKILRAGALIGWNECVKYSLNKLKVSEEQAECNIE